MTATDDALTTMRTSSEMQLARISPSPSVELQALLERAVVVALGAASLVAAVVAKALARSFDTEAGDFEGPRGRPSVPEPPTRFAGALLGLAVEATRWSTRAAAPVARRLGEVLSIAGDLPPIRLAGSRLGDVVQRLEASWGDGRPRREESASAFIRSLITDVVDATLDQIDLTSLVLERIDVDRFLDAIDLNSLIDRVDIDRALERIDLNEVVDRIDIERIVARVDVDELAARVDLEAMIERLELVKIAEEVIDELDVGELIRDSTGSMATETVEGIRVQGMNADRFVARLVDRAFGRRDNDDPRSLGGNGQPSGPER
jgi:hypothetical protein